MKTTDLIGKSGFVSRVLGGARFGVGVAAACVGVAGAVLFGAADRAVAGAFAVSVSEASRLVVVMRLSWLGSNWILLCVSGRTRWLG